MTCTANGFKVSRTAAFTNQKKVRGWKTQIKRVERWRTRHLKPDHEFFRQNGVAYCKLWIDPWHRLTRRQPPIWLGRQMIYGLLDLYEAWVSTAVPEVEYLKVWLMWPELTESQVVMAGTTKAEMYQK